MAISSIHIASGKAGYLSHNDRSLPTKNSIFKDEKNEVFNGHKKAFETYRQELQIRSEEYTNRTKQKLQKNSITHLSAIVNLNQHHTLDDLQPLIQHLEDTLDTKVFQVAIHRDEGHIKDGENMKNYHAHIEFMGLDSQGSSVRRKLTRQYLKDLQTQTADILKMERGQKNSKAKRLDTYEFKKHKEKEEKTLKPILAKQKDLKEQIATIRAELKEQKAGRQEYAKIEELNRTLKEQIKSKELTAEELEQRLTAYKSSEMPRHLKSFTPQNINFKLSEVTLKDGVFGSRKVKVLSEIEAIKLHQNYKDLKEVYSKVYEFASEQKIEIVKTEIEVEKEVIVEKIVYKNEPINEELKQQNKSLIKDISNIINENTKLQKEFDEYKKDTKTKEENLEDIELLKEKSRSNTKLIIAQEKEITAYKQSIEQLKNQPPVKIENPINQQLEQEVQDLKNQIETLDELAYISGENNPVNKHLKEEIEELKTKVYHPEMKHSDGTKATFEETTEHYKQKLESTEELLDNSYDDNNKHLHNLKIAREEIKQQKATIDTLEAEIRGYKQSIEQLEAEIKQLKRDLRTYRGTDRQTKRAELNQMEQEDKQLHQQLDQAKGLTASLSHLISKSDRQILEDMIEEGKKIKKEEEEKPKSDPTPRPYSPPFRM